MKRSIADIFSSERSKAHSRELNVQITSNRLVSNETKKRQSFLDTLNDNLKSSANSVPTPCQSLCSLFELDFQQGRLETSIFGTQLASHHLFAESRRVFINSHLNSNTRSQIIISADHIEEYERVHVLHASDRKFMLPKGLIPESTASIEKLTVQSILEVGPSIFLVLCVCSNCVGSEYHQWIHLKKSPRSHKARNSSSSRTATTQNLQRCERMSKVSAPSLVARP